MWRSPVWSCERCSTSWMVVDVHPPRRRRFVTPRVDDVTARETLREAPGSMDTDFPGCVW